MDEDHLGGYGVQPLLLSLCPICEKKINWLSGRVSLIAELSMHQELGNHQRETVQGQQRFCAIQHYVCPPNHCHPLTQLHYHAVRCRVGY